MQFKLKTIHTTRKWNQSSVHCVGKYLIEFGDVGYTILEAKLCQSPLTVPCETSSL